MKFAIGSRAYGKNSPFLAESDCFFDCLRKKEAEYEIIARKREGKFSEIGRLKYEIPRFFNDGRNVRKSQLRIEKKVCYNIKIKGHKLSFYIGVCKNIFPKQAYKT